jgi:hypothetical protein
VLIGGPGLSGFSGDSGSVVLLVFVWAAWCGSDRFLVFCSVWFCSVFGVVFGCSKFIRCAVWCGVLVRIRNFWASAVNVGWCCERGLVQLQ